MTVNASELRANVYRLLDQVLATGQPLVVRRGRRHLRILPEPEPAPSRLGRLVRRDCLRGDPEGLVHLDWSGEWRHDLP